MASSLSQKEKAYFYCKQNVHNANEIVAQKEFHSIEIFWTGF